MNPIEPPPQTILVYVGIDLIGDGLMKLPFVRALRAAYPEAHITWLAGKGKSVYAGKLASLTHGLIDEVIEDADIGSHWREVFGDPLKGRHFDLVIDTQRRFKTSLILKRIAHRTFVSGAAGYLLSDIKPAGGRKKPAAMIRQMLALLEMCSGQTPRTDGKITLEEGVLKAAADHIVEGPAHIALAPGAGARHRCWPLDDFITLANQLAGRGHVPVFFLGPDELDWRERLEKAVPQALFPLQDNTTYGVAPDFTIAIARRCAAAVAADCGQNHLFAAADIPLITLYGPSSPDKFAPVTRDFTPLRAQDYADSNQTAAIPVEAVNAAIEQAISRSK